MRNNRGYTYLVTNGTHYKIGITTGTPDKRVAELQTGSPTKITISGYSYNTNALSMEMELHKRFSSKRLEGEWFELDDDDVAIIHYHFENNYLDEYHAPLSQKAISIAKNKAEENEKLRLEAKKQEEEAIARNLYEWQVEKSLKIAMLFLVFGIIGLGIGLAFALSLLVGLSFFITLFSISVLALEIFVRKKSAFTNWGDVVMTILMSVAVTIAIVILSQHLVL